MAIFYIDLVNGNDANSGTDWANAWKTFTTGATFARLAPGDELRIAKTPQSSLGNATWTDSQTGFGISFSTPPTKQIDTCQSGWTAFAGTTVTNAQTTAYIVSGGALRCVTSATANMGYKTLASATDFSGQQIVSFWFRPAAAFDCTGAQNLLITLCSDTAGVTAVNTITAPKLNYSANRWYPIVVDTGGALGSSIQSVAIRTTNSTSGTFYFAEMFASPAGGLTLDSVISPDDGNGMWYPVLAVRDNLVQLHCAANPTSAIGASSVSSSFATDYAWMGTTGTYTTYLINPVYVPSSDLTLTRAGTSGNVISYVGGYNKATSTVDGVTLISRLGFDPSSAAFSQGVSWTAVKNIAFHHYSTANFLGAANCTVDNVGFVGGSGALSLGNSTNVASPTTPTTVWSGNGNAGGVFCALLCPTKNYWGNASHSFLLSDTNYCTTVGNVYVIDATAGIYPNFTLGSRTRKMTVGEVKGIPRTGSSSVSITPNVSASASNSLKDMPQIYFAKSQGLRLASNTFAYVRIGQLINSGTVTALYSAFGNTVILKVDDWNGQALNFVGGNSTEILSTTARLRVLDYDGPGLHRIYCGDGQNVTATTIYYNLQSADVSTSGSLAWKLNTTTIPATGLNNLFDMPLASCAAVANKLVTVTANVKRSHNSITAGIRIPSNMGEVPGYSSDMTQSVTSTGSFDTLTITFTPTANCVFDVIADAVYTSSVASGVVWDDLTITQAE